MYIMGTEGDMDRLKEIYQSMQKCDECVIAGMDANRLNKALGHGKLEGYGRGKCMFVAMNPSYRRFPNLVTPCDAGISQWFINKIVKLGLHCDDIFFTNLVKCSTEGNRELCVEEIKCCSRWLYKEINAIKPRLLVCLGRIVYDTLLEFEYLKVPIAKLWHPSYVGRDLSREPVYDQQIKRLIALWEVQKR